MLARQREAMVRAAAAMPMHAEFIARYCASAEPR
jgi:tryptophan halogenase